MSVALRTRFYFQYQKKGSTIVDSLKLSDVPTEVNSGCPIPNVGDIIKIQVCHPNRDIFEDFRVLRKEYQYAQETSTNGGYGAINNCDIVLTVTEVD